MPTYEYACTECGERVEVVQRITDAPLEVCGVCGGKLRKLFHPVGIAFKGSGFYTTDSRRGGGAKEGADSKDGPSGKSEKKEGKDKEKKASA